MRIIAGELRGRKLSSPKGQGTRPMLDRVREAIFNILGQGLEGAEVLDLFAGTGSLGLEALSRGAARVRFVEADRNVRRILTGNVAELGLEDRAEVLGGDALAAPAGGDGEGWDSVPPDLVFLDPPYPMIQEAWGRSAVLAVLARHASAGAVVVLHAPRGLLNEEAFGEGLLAEERTYGTTTIWFVEAAAEEVSDGE